MKHKQLINIHAKRYIEEVFEECLIEEGFVCPDDKLLCWYRMNGNEVLNSVFFSSAWNNLPLCINVNYQVLPLFTLPMRIMNVHHNFMLDEDKDVRELQLQEAPPFIHAPRAYSNEIQVCAPEGAGRGLYTLTDCILPQISEITTLQDAYQYHKQYVIDVATHYHKPVDFEFVSRSFVEEAIYVDDAEVYPLLKARVLKEIERYEDLVAERLPNKDFDQIIKDSYKEEIEPELYALLKREWFRARGNIKQPRCKPEWKEELFHWQQLKTALFDNAREEYLVTLETRIQKNIQILKKRYLLDEGCTGL